MLRVITICLRLLCSASLSPRRNTRRHTLCTHMQKNLRARQYGAAIKAKIARTNPKYTGNHSAILTPRSWFHYVMVGAGKLLEETCSCTKVVKEHLKQKIPSANRRIFAFPSRKLKSMGRKDSVLISVTITSL